MSLTNRDLWIDPSETEREGTKLFGHLLLLAVMAIVIIGLVWAHYAVLDEVTRGEAKVIPSSQIQVIQSVKGGKLKALNVREGDIVQADQVVAVLDNTELATNENELRQRKWTAEAALARLQAEIAGKDDPSQIAFPDDLVKEAPEVAETEKSVSLSVSSSCSRSARPCNRRSRPSSRSCGRSTPRFRRRTRASISRRSRSTSWTRW